MQGYSRDLRDRVLRALGRGDRPTEIARRFEVSRVWVHQVRSRRECGGGTASLPVGGHRVSRVAPLEAVIRAWIAGRPDLTLAEICSKPAAAHGVAIKITALCQQLAKWGFTY